MLPIQPDESDSGAFNAALDGSVGETVSAIGVCYFLDDRADKGSRHANSA